MAYEITLPNGEKVRTDELLHGEVVDLAKAHKTSWSHVVEMPVVGDGELMLDLYARQCAKRDLKVPNVLTSPKLASFYKRVPTIGDEADGDQPADDGEDGEQDPPTVDAPAST